MQIQAAAGISPLTFEDVREGFSTSVLITDPLIGYSIKGPPGSQLADPMIQANAALAPILSLDLPAGMHANSGMTTRLLMEADWTLTLVLPKIDLHAYHGDLYLGDIGTPYKLY